MFHCGSGATIASVARVVTTDANPRQVEAWLYAGVASVSTPTIERKDEAGILKYNLELGNVVQSILKGVGS